MKLTSSLLLAVLLAAPLASAQTDSTPMPPGWIPVNRMDDKMRWEEFRKISDKVHLYLPPGDAKVRGIFVCYVFHSADPREFARLWNFALVTIPTPFEYDLGYHDQRNQRPKITNLPLGNMGVLLRFLDAAATETRHPELASAPIIGWLGQNGARLCADLDQRAPGRVLAWGDAWYHDWPKYPDLIARIPVASAWELNAMVRGAERAKFLPNVEGKPTPPRGLRCYATTYGFKHGIYSKFNFFMMYFDRVIALRLGNRGLQPASLEAGWAADFNLISEFTPIVPVKDAKGMVLPVWMPDEAMAHAYRAYHSNCTDLRITQPLRSYNKGAGAVNGAGYNGYLTAGQPTTLAAEVGTNYTKVAFFDWNQKLGEATAAPWQIQGVTLAPGLRVLYAVGTRADGSQAACRPALGIAR